MRGKRGGGGAGGGAAGPARRGAPPRRPAASLPWRLMAAVEGGKAAYRPTGAGRGRLWRRGPGPAGWRPGGAAACVVPPLPPPCASWRGLAGVGAAAIRSLPPAGIVWGIEGGIREPAGGGINKVCLNRSLLQV